VKSLRHVYSARCLVLSRNSGLKMALLNAKKESQVLAEGTELGEIHDVKIVMKGSKEKEKADKLSKLQKNALKKIIKTFSPDMTDQKQKAWELLVRYSTIISTGDHDKS